MSESYGGDLARLEERAEEVIKPFDPADLDLLPRVIAPPPARRQKPDDEEDAPTNAKFERLASLYVDHLRRSGQVPLHHHGRFYVYRGCRYVEETELPDKLRAYFKATGRPQSNNVIGNVVPIVQSHGYRPLTDHPEMPFYAGRGVFPKPDAVIAYRNGLLDVDAYLAGQAKLIPPHAGLVFDVLLAVPVRPGRPVPPLAGLPRGGV